MRYFVRYFDIFLTYFVGGGGGGGVLSVSPYQGPVSRKSRKRFGPVKPFVKLRPAYSVKLVSSYVVKGIEIKITTKFRASRRLRFEDTKRIMSPEMRPKRFGTFEKKTPQARIFRASLLLLFKMPMKRNFSLAYLKELSK